MRQGTFTEAYGAVIAAFLSGSVTHIIPWIMVSFMVIVCDLAFGLRKAYLMGERIRFSKACRNTMGKVVTYFSFVITVCFINQAAGGEYDIDKWSCLIVCLIEGFSVFDNILEPMGIHLDLSKALDAVLRKVSGAGGIVSEAVKDKDINDGRDKEGDKDGGS